MRQSAKASLTASEPFLIHTSRVQVSIQVLLQKPGFESHSLTMTSDSFTSKMKSILPSLSFRQTVATATQGDGRQIYRFRTISRSSITSIVSGSTKPKSDQVAGHDVSFLGDSSPITQPTINVVLFGETGVGKSSVINLIARKDIAKVSSDVNGCTMQSTRYDISFDDMNFAIFDTIGLEEPQMGVNGYLKAIEKTYELIVKLGAVGGVHLLLFCMRWGRITATMQANYQLFCEHLCHTRVPIALVFTGLEREAEMEDWWARNKTHIERYGIRGDGHACIPAVQDDDSGGDVQYMESQKRIRELLRSCALKHDAFLPEPHIWFARLGRGMKSFIAKHRNPRKRDVMKVLTNRCKLDPETARKIAEMMEKGDTQTKDEQAGNAEGEGRSNLEVRADRKVEGGVAKDFRSSYSDNILRERKISRVRAQKAALQDTIKSLRTLERSIEITVNLEEKVQELCRELAASQRAAAQENNCLDETIESLRADLRAQNESSNSKIAHVKQTVQELHSELADCQHKTDSLVRILRAREQKYECEILYAEGRKIDAAASLLEIANTMTEGVRTDKLIMDWLADFTNRCISALETIGGDASRAGKHDEALKIYSTVLSLSSSTPNTLLAKWASTVLIRHLVDDALRAAAKFKLPRFDVYRAICDVLEGDGRVSEAIECFRQMHSELGKETSIHDGRAKWEPGFQRRCAVGLEKLGDVAMDSQNHNEAAEHFSVILSFNLVDRTEILVKRSRARALMNSWEGALSDADEVIRLDPSSHRGYERRHVALQGIGRHSEAFGAFEMMLSKLGQSPDPQIRELRHQYIDPTPMIQRVVEQTIRHMPRVLIDTTTGRLHDKTQQVLAFEKLPIYDELRSSMAIRLDPARIRREAENSYRYVMLSHKWEYGEPLFQTVEHISIYNLESSSPNIKLQKFCTLARSLGFQWAWSDTCCIDKKDNVVLQESLVAMFTWYRGSSLTIVYLRGIWSQSQQPGDLRESIWNTRAWPYQEYVAAETIQFYTEDWKPYLGLTQFNHKELPAIISEMQQVTRVSAQESAMFCPGLDRVREKLCVASVRQTTLVEDIAYSLLGIFNASIPVIYGEGNRAVGRLLEHVLTGSGDVTVLAWTGRAGDYNSCLPVDLTVYSELVPPHVPQPIKKVEMDGMITTLRSSLRNLSLAATLHKHFGQLPLPYLSANRLRLPGIVFPLAELVHVSGPDPVSSLHVYHAMASTFGDVEIETADNLTGMKDLCLVHPWIRPLLDQEFSDGAAALDRNIQALRFIARLRQPFGALLFKPVSRVEYRRVATDSLILVQIREEVPLTELIDNTRTIEVH